MNPGVIAVRPAVTALELGGSPDLTGLKMEAVYQWMAGCSSYCRAIRCPTAPIQVGICSGEAHESG